MEARERSSWLNTSQRIVLRSFLDEKMKDDGRDMSSYVKIFVQKCP